MIVSFEKKEPQKQFEVVTYTTVFSRLYFD